jgi:hypothetical protein
MAMKKSTPPSGNPGGRISYPISSSVTVRGKQIIPGLAGSPLKALTGKQLAEAKALAAKIKAMEVKAAADKKANAKIIKKQNKKSSTPALDKVTKAAALAKKKVIKVTPPKGRPGLRGFGGGGGLFGTKNR